MQGGAPHAYHVSFGRRRSARGAADGRPRAERVPEQAGQIHRAVPGRRHQRRAGADRRRQTAGQVGPADHHRAEDRRRRQHRRRSRGAGRARRAHAVRRAARAAGDQPEPLQEALLQARGFRADHGAGQRSERHHREEGVAGQFAAGTGRVHQEQPRQGRVRQPGQRRDAASHRQHVHDPDRHADGACALSRRNAGAPGHARRPRRSVLRQRLGGARAVARRQGQGAGGARQEALRADARRADRRRRRACPASSPSAGSPWPARRRCRRRCATRSPGTSSRC